MSKEIKLFVRSHPNAGVYGICWKKRQIQIKNREIFSTDDKGLIKVFMSDSEIMELKTEPKPTSKEILDYDKMPKKDLLIICKSRNLVDDVVTVKDVKKSDLVKMLKYDDKINSKPENDPGEQIPEK